MKCGLCGTWAWIKSQECKPKPNSPPCEIPKPAEPVSVMDLLSAQLCEALESEDNTQALEIVGVMELQDAQERLEDQELALALLEEELRMVELSEQLEQMQLEEGSKKAMETLRPPATPATAKTLPPSVLPATVCF